MAPNVPLTPPRVVLLGGAYGALALARSLKGAGFQVWVVTHETRCPSFSGAVHKAVHWVGPEHPRTLEALEEIARSNSLAGSMLIPCADPEVRLVAEAHQRLSAVFDVLTLAWEQLRWACDKALTYQRAQALGLGVPHVYPSALLNEPGLGALKFPLVLKPSMRLSMNRFTAERCWRIDDRESFSQRYKAACDMVGAETVIAQQLIPGGGESQLSYAGLWLRGEPVVSLTARRLRQYPVEFGSTSTYVMTADLPDVAAAAETFLRSIRHHGLAEIEFKRDPRDGILKLLDVNPRPWNWMGLAAGAGVDFGRAIASMASRQPVPPMKARAGVAWIFATHDLIAAARSGRLRPQAILGYAATWARVRRFACFSWADPIPGIVDAPATLVRMMYRRLKRPRAPGPRARASRAEPDNFVGISRTNREVSPTPIGARASILEASGVFRMRQTDIVIAGGGLAGSMAAAMLARAGFDVVLVDPHAVYPPDLRCEKLDRAQVEILRRTGLADVVLPAATPDMEAWVARFGRVIDKRPGDQHGILYDTLVNTVRAAIPAGAFVHDKVTAIANTAHRQTVTIASGEEISARLAIVANGLNSGLRNALGMAREDVSKCHCITLAFDLKPVGRSRFDFGSLTYYSDRTADRFAYITLFPIGHMMRANIMVYRDIDDPWLRAMRQPRPEAAMFSIMPRLARLTGAAEVVGPVKIRPADLYITRGYLQPGIVLVGDAFATSCPAAGTGADKVFTDVERLCNVHVPQWMATDGMGVEKIKSFYADPVKLACDRISFEQAFSHRSIAIDESLYWRAERWARFLARLAIGSARGAFAQPVAPTSQQTP